MNKAHTFCGAANPDHWSRRRLLAALPALSLLGACSTTGNIRLGFLGPLSHSAFELGEAGRNGAMLAIDTRNANGGIHGRPLELLLEDDGQSPDRARAAFERLTQAGVTAIIGPFLSATAAAVVPMANEKRMVLISPTVTSMDFHGKDDYFIRIHRNTRDNARDYAQQVHARGWQRLAIAYDERNRSFTRSWLEEFRSAFLPLGGTVLLELGFGAEGEPRYGDIARELLRERADALLFVANALDTARLGQLARQAQPGTPLVSAEWAASETLIELGGRMIDGMLVMQPYDREDRSTRYKTFRDNYLVRYKREPSYSAVHSHDAATVLMEALLAQEKRQSLKEAILSRGPYDGLQQQIVFDANGDTERRVFFTQIRNGQFLPA